MFLTPKKVILPDETKNVFEYFKMAANILVFMRLTYFISWGVGGKPRTTIRISSRNRGQKEKLSSVSWQV